MTSCNAEARKNLWHAKRAAELVPTKRAVAVRLTLRHQDKNNEFSGTATILPITSKNLQKIYPFEVLLSKGNGKLPKTSKVKADQIRTLDKKRIVKFIGAISKQKMDEIEKAIRVHLALS